MSSFAEVIRARRLQLGMTLADVAEGAGCSKAYLSGIENDRHRYPPSDPVLRGIERALKMSKGALQPMADWLATPDSVKKSLEACGVTLEEGQIRRGTPPSSPAAQRGVSPPIPLRRVPLINRIAAGRATEFTDLDYPLDVADDYVEVPIDDKRAFAARVIGDSMLPTYREGDVVVFSPETEAEDGSDCFVRLLPDHEITFKRLLMEKDGRLRLQPLNRAFPARIVERKQVSGLYPAVAMVRPIMPQPQKS